MTVRVLDIKNENRSRYLIVFDVFIDRNRKVKYNFKLAFGTEVPAPKQLGMHRNEKSCPKPKPNVIKNLTNKYIHIFGFCTTA